MCPPRSVSAEKYENSANLSCKLEENLGSAGHLLCPTSFPMAASLGSIRGWSLWPLKLFLLAVQHSQKPPASGIGWLAVNYPFPHPSSASA